MSDRDEFGAFLVGFVVGGLAGAVTALLLAPQSGEETRTVIKEKAIELKDKASDSFDDVYDKAEEYVQEAKTKAVDLQHKGQVVLEEQKSKLAGIKKDVKPAGNTTA
jgi:gas vesicle protein